MIRGIHRDPRPAASCTGSAASSRVPPRGRSAHVQ
jgi:hypothetical protein